MTAEVADEKKMFMPAISELGGLLPGFTLSGEEEVI